jgi:pre-mRNA-splicing factor CDC5/CEF1
MAAGVTPARSGAASVSATPLRDALRINDAKFSDAPLDARDAKRRAAATRDELRDGLASLPAPANEYRIEVPDAPAEEEEEEGDGADAMEEDLADIRAREAERRREEEAAALRRRSAAIRRDLPRPPPGSRGPTTEAAPSVVAGGSLHESALAAASTLIAAELASLLAHDAARYPPRGEKARAAEAAPDLPRVEENEMADAAALVAAEVPAVRAEMGHADVSSEALAEALASVRAETVVGADGQLVARTSLSKAQRIAILERELASVAAAAAADAKRVAKLEHKAGLLTAGLQKRAEALISKLGETGDALAAAREEKASYARLHEREQRAAPRRIETLMELASKARTREAGLQDAYARLKG